MFFSWLIIKGLTFINTDLPLALFGAQIIEYYPQVLKKGILLDLPWFVVSLWKIFERFSPKSLTEIIIVAKQEELYNYIDLDMYDLVHLPGDDLGSDERVTDGVMGEVLPLYECKHLNFTDKQIDKFYKVYEFNRNE